MKKKFVSLLLGLGVLAAVTGCSSKPKETEAETKAATEAVVTEAAAEETEAAEVAEAVSEAVEEAAEAVSEVAEEAAEAVSEAGEEAAEAVSEAAEEAAEAVSEAAEEAAEAVSEVAEAAEEETEAVEETTEAVEEAVEEVTEAAAAVEEVTEAVEVETEAAEEEITEAVEVETEAAEEEITEAVEVETEAAEEEVTEAVEVETEAAEEEATEAVTEAAVEEETEAAEEATEAVTEAAAEEETEAAEEVTEEVTEAAEEETEAVTEAVEEETEAVTEAVEVETEAAEEETEAVTEAVEEETEAAEEEVTEAFEEFAEEAEDVFAVLPIVPVVQDTVTTGTLDDFDITDEDVVILFNNDVHGGICGDSNYSGSSLSLGYAGMAAVVDDASEKAGEYTVVDLGDAIQGSVVTTETDGKVVMDMMDEIGYDIQVPGNHEFDYGMEYFLEYAENANTEFISSNFVDNRTGEAVFDGYTLEEYEVNSVGFTVGYVGMTSPETIAKSTPAYFQDEEGNYIYGFNADTPQDLYDNIQASIDAAYEDGADFVIALGHMGDTGVEEDWSSISVIENTTGLSAFLDAHAHSAIPSMIVQDKDGKDVVLASTGTKLENIGILKMHASKDGEIEISTGLVNELTEDEVNSDAYADLDEMVQAVEDEYAYLFVKVGSTDFDLVIYDPETGDRLIRNTETNLGDFLSDAYRNYFQADIGVINGGSIRANIDAGDITYMDIITVYPWNTTTGVVEVSGQVVLDMLEMGAHLYPEECGGWIQPSGITYLIDTTIPSSVVVNAEGEFVSVDGEYRVKHVLVNGEPLDLEKDYTVAINTYYSQSYGDGMTMFKGCKVLIPAEGEDEIVDHDVVIDYLAQIGDKVPGRYKDPYGEGRFLIIDESNIELMKAVEAAAETFAEAEEAVSEAIGDAGEALSSAASEAEEALSSAASEAQEAISEAMETIGGAVGEVHETVSGVVDEISSMAEEGETEIATEASTLVTGKSRGIYGKG